MQVIVEVETWLYQPNILPNWSICTAWQKSEDLRFPIGCDVDYHSGHKSYNFAIFEKMGLFGGPPMEVMGTLVVFFVFKHEDLYEYVKSVAQHFLR